MSPRVLHAELERRDPVMAARLRPSDPQRIVRALEVMEATGRSLADWQAERSPPVLPPGAGVRRLVLSPDRAVLRARIAERFAAMMENGAVEEAERLVARGLDPGLPVMKAIGVAPLAAYAAGRLGRDEAVARAVTASRQYAKRQDTWFRRRFADWTHCATVDEALARAA
jgi:tRNA dimethylallyltransferase